MPSPPTTRNAPGRNTRSACRSSCRPSAAGARSVARATSAPSRRASGRRASFARVATTKRPKGDHDASRYGPSSRFEPSCSTTHAPESADHEQPTRSREGEERRRALLDTDDLADLVQDRAAGRAEQPCEHDERRGRRERLPRTAARLRLALRERRRDDRPRARARAVLVRELDPPKRSLTATRGASSPRRRRELTVPRGTPRSSAISPGVY